MISLVVSGISSRKAFRIFAVCSRIYRTGAVIQDQHLRFFQKCPGNTQPLLLSAGYVGTALLNIGIIFFRHPLNKFIGAGQSTGTDALLLGGMLITPAKVVQNRTGKQHVLLQVQRIPRLRSASMSYSRTSVSAYLYAYLPVTSYSRLIRLTRLVLALPVPPMMPMVSPACNRTD